MSSGFKKSLIAFSVSSVLAAPAVYATNGMNVEGYGPVAAAMGGASMAYENGSAATMNNPATLGLMNDGQNRLEVAVGFLGPDVEASAGPFSAKSGGDAYYMPAMGWTKKEGKLTYGVGMFAQGGMGTEYAADTFMSAPTGSPTGTSTDPVRPTRSEVGVGRLIAPLAYNVNDKVIVGGSLDFVWAGMDIMMAMPGNASGFGDFIESTVGGGLANGNHFGGIATGSLVDGLVGAMAGTDGDLTTPGDAFVTAVDWVRFDFSNSSDFTGEATATGFGAKIGFVAKEGKLSIGGAYHFKTSISDMESSNATVSMNIDGPMVSNTPTTVSVTGKVKVVDFQWPATLGLGAAYELSDKWLVVADLRQIMWSDVMDSFRMTFAADSTQADTNAAGFAGLSMAMEMYQNWKDQNVIQLGASYKMDDALTLRFGASAANNPCPDAYMNPLFPAIEKNHITAGVGYKVSDNQNVDFAVMEALNVDQTNGQGILVEHSQLSWQFMYTHNF